MRAVPPWPGPVMDWGQGLQFVGHQRLTPWDTLVVPWGTSSTCNPGEDAIRQGGRRREPDAGDSERPLLLCAASSTRGVAGEGQAGKL